MVLVYKYYLYPRAGSLENVAKSEDGGCSGVVLCTSRFFGSKSWWLLS